MIELKVPLLPDESDQVEVVAIHSKEGDRVKQDQSILEIETEKVVLDIFAPHDGVIQTLTVKVGDKFSQEEVLCVVDADEDTYQEDVEHIEEMFAAELGEQIADAVGLDATAESDDTAQSSYTAQSEDTAQSSNTAQSEDLPVSDFVGEQLEDDEIVYEDLEEDELRQIASAGLNISPGGDASVRQVTKVIDDESTDSDLISETIVLSESELRAEKRASQKIEPIIESELTIDAPIAEELENIKETPDIEEEEEEATKDGFTIFIVMLIILGLGAFAFHYFELAPVFSALIERIL